MSTSTVRVYLRLRPVIYQEGKEPEETCVRAVNHNKVELLNWRNVQETLQYTFNQVFAEDSSQDEVFCTCVQPLLTRFVEQRHNATVFAYGPTGSGKTFTMLGTNTEPGMIPRTMGALFGKVRQLSNNKEENFALSMSYLEIYQEKVHDLLQKGNNDLPIRVDGSGRIFVSGLTEKEISNFETFERLFLPASKNRTVGATKLNSRSSRSHSILQIQLNSWKTSRPDRRQKAKLFLIDLADAIEDAQVFFYPSIYSMLPKLPDLLSFGLLRSFIASHSGSEDNRRTGNTGVRLKESGSINTSLHVLGKVVDALNIGSTGRIPYRDSKLTRLLQDSLGGSAHTCMVVNISPEISSIYDTHSTMNFATKSKSIINKPFTQEVKVEPKENIKPLEKPKVVVNNRKTSNETQPSVPFLSPLIRKHMKKMEQQLQSKLDRIENLVRVHNETEDDKVAKEDASKTEETFRQHDFHLDEIRKSTTTFKNLHAKQRELNESKQKRNLLEGPSVNDESPFIIKRKKVSSAASVSGHHPDLQQHLRNRNTFLTIEKQQCGKENEIITIKIPANSSEMHSAKLLHVLNSGDEKLLRTLHGIGSVRAGQIIKFREEVGKFEKINDLERILPKQFVKKFLEKSLLNSLQLEVF